MAPCYRKGGREQQPFTCIIVKKSLRKKEQGKTEEERVEIGLKKEEEEEFIFSETSLPFKLQQS